MTIKEFFSRLGGVKAEQEAAAIATYGDLVREVAAGNDPDPTEADAILQASGKRIEDLQADVARRVERERLKAELAQLPALREKRTQLTAEIQTTRDKLQELLAILKRLNGLDGGVLFTDHPAAGSLEHQLRAVSERINKLTNTRRELISSAPEAMKAQRNQLQQQHRSTNDNAHRARQRAFESSERLKTCRRRLENFNGSKSDKAELLAQIEQLESAIAADEAAQASTLAKVALLDEQLEAYELEMIAAD